MRRKPQAVMDVECYRNYFLVAFARMTDGVVATFERTPERELDVEMLRKVLAKYELVTFNGIKYDVPILRMALTGATNAELKAASDALIGDMTPYNFERRYRLSPWPIDYIDLWHVAPAAAQKCSLKMYAAKMHCERLQDLPYDPDSTLTDDQAALLKEYCCLGDLPATAELCRRLSEQIELRREMSVRYRCDLRSKSDAQVAEAVIKSEIQRALGIRVSAPETRPSEVVYDPPDFIRFEDRRLQHALDVVVSKPMPVTGSGKIQMHEAIQNLSIPFGRSVYRMGIGGLHSSESKAAHRADDDWLIADWDVASYYPAIILNCGLYPETLGERFLDVYRGIVDERLAAKRAGDRVRDQSLKITINGSFGKLGSAYSALYAPKLMVQVTITGQLALLMLIEALESRGIHVVSANTDGIVCKCPRKRESAMVITIREWEERTGFTMERTDYSAVYSRDVNNYIAVKTDGKIKAKGCFASPNLKKNPSMEVCNEAIVEYLTGGVPLIETISACRDIRKFLMVRKVDGGAIQGDVYLGKTVRWYYARGERRDIRYKNSGNAVPMTVGARPAMQLPAEFPADVDHDRYVREAEDMLVGLGVPVKGQMSLF